MIAKGNLIVYLCSTILIKKITDMKIENAILRDILRKKHVSNNKINIKSFLFRIVNRKSLFATFTSLNIVNNTNIITTKQI